MVSAPSPTPEDFHVTATALPESDHLGTAVSNRPPLPVKMVIAGGFGVGKTTTVAAISEIEPLTTEASITEVAAGVDDLTHTPHKTTTTVAMDFGCITLDPTLKLYLFGTPGQDRFGFMWDDLVEGALGGLVIVDTRRLDDCFAAVDYFENKGLPFAVRQGGLTQIDHIQDHWRHWQHHLTRQAIRGREDSAQRLVAADNGGERFLQCRQIERSA